ncbi:family methyltransferase [Leptolyngbya sp. Heron Island J]|nr:family methyltransferase [Leptolyngbya sp. Heron Island J]
MHPNSENRRVKGILKFLGWQFYKRIFKKPVDIEIIPKFKIRCYPNGYSAASVLYCGLYDYNEMNFLLRYLRPEDSFLDIGANVGIYSILAASRISLGKVFSFEPLPKNIDRLKENCKLNKFDHIEIHSVAISDIQGEIALNLAEGDSMPFITSSPEENSITVPTDTLDNIFRGRELKQLTLAKIDIEGAEFLAFKGARSLLEKHLPYVWILEINNTIKNFNHTEEDVVSLLNSFGYHLYDYDAAHNCLKPIGLKQQQGKNALAIADSHLDFVRERLAK